MAGWKRIKAGDLRHRVGLERSTVATNAHGDPVPAWSAVGEQWAQVEVLGGRELADARQVNPRASYSVLLRYTAEALPTERDRLTWEGRVLNVVNVQVDPVRESVVVLAEEAR